MEPGKGLAPRARRDRDQHGFTLVELLVVLLVIAILAGIAIPVFLAQRNKGRIAAAQRSLKDAALAAEAYGTDNGGNYSGLDDDGLTKLENNGFNPTASINIVVKSAQPDEYCIMAQSILLETTHPWYYATYRPAKGRPTEDDENLCAAQSPDLPLEFPSLPACSPPLLVPPLCSG